jgi:cadmium resistance protein CadD (predicted permease)
MSFWVSIKNLTQTKELNMQIKLDKKDLMNGVEIVIPGTIGNPADPIDVNCPIYIELYEGKILVHIWNGDQDPVTTELKTKS